MLGDVWTDLGPIADDPNVEAVRCLAYLGNGIVIAGGEMSPPVPQFSRNRIFRSTDYGETWTNLGQIANNAQIVYSLYNAGGGRILAGFGLGTTVGPHKTGAQIYESTDWGQTWHLVIIFPNGCYMVRGIAKCAGNIWCACGIWQAVANLFGVIWRSLDDGATWPEQFDIDPGNQQGAFDILYLGSNEVLAATKRAGAATGLIYKSNANGADSTWNIVLAESAGEVQSRCFSEGDAGIIVGGLDAHIVRTTDGGNNWNDMGQVLPLAASEVFDISFFGNSLFLAFGSDGHVVRSIDNGLNWTDLGKKTTTLGEGFDCCLYVESNYALAGSDNGHIYKSGSLQPEIEVVDVSPSPYKLKVGKYIITCDASKQNVIDAHFTLRQNGGCAEFNFKLGRPDFDISLGDEVLIYLYGQVAPWYRGRIQERTRDGASTRIRNYSGYGHFEFLNGGDLVDVRYGAGEAIDDLRDAVIDVLDTCIRPYGTLITANNAKIEDPSHTITELEFDMVKPIDALTDLCELAEGWEFGVDEVGDFYFRQELASTLEDKWIGKHVATFIPSENMRNLVNRWYLEGGALAAGSNYDSLVEDVISQGLYGLRSDKATMPSGMNTGEIGRWGDDLLAKSKDPVMKATISGIDVERTQTRIWPRGKMRLTSEDGKHSYRFPIRALTYHITPAGVTADVELGPKTTHIRDYLADLDKKIKKEREQLAIDVYQLAMGTGLVDDCIKDNHIDWGTGAGQVSGIDIPIADAGTHFATDNVEAALQEVADDRENMMALIYLSLFRH